MSSVNKVIIVGNCGRDPEVRYLPDGRAVANVSVATTSRRKDKQTGEAIEDTQWHRITFYDRLAEIAGDYLKKGKSIYVEGRLKYGKYTDKDGVEKNTTDIIATEMQLLGSRNDGDGEQQQAPRQRQQEGAAPRQQQRQGYDNQPRRQPEQRRQQPQQRGGGGGSTGFDDFDSDDIPF